MSRLQSLYWVRVLIRQVIINRAFVKWFQWFYCFSWVCAMLWLQISTASAQHIVVYMYSVETVGELFCYYHFLPVTAVGGLVSYWHKLAFLELCQILGMFVILSLLLSFLISLLLPCVSMRHLGGGRLRKYRSRGSTKQQLN